MNSHSYSSNPGNFSLMLETGDNDTAKSIIRLLTAILCLLSNLATMISAAVPQTIKQSPFGKQEDSGTSKSTLDEVFTLEGATVSSGPGSSTQSEETRNPLETSSPIPTSTTSSFPYLKVSGLTPEQQEGLSIRLCVESEGIVHNSGTFTPESSSHCVNKIFLWTS